MATNEELSVLAEKLMSGLAFLRNDYKRLVGDDLSDDAVLHLGHSESLIHQARRVLNAEET